MRQYQKRGEELRAVANEGVHGHEKEQNLRVASDFESSSSQEKQPQAKARGCIF